MKEDFFDLIGEEFGKFVYYFSNYGFCYWKLKKIIKVILKVGFKFYNRINLILYIIV